MTFDGIPFEDTNRRRTIPGRTFLVAGPIQSISTAARASHRALAPPTSAGRSICIAPAISGPGHSRDVGLWLVQYPRAPIGRRQRLFRKRQQEQLPDEHSAITVRWISNLQPPETRGRVRQVPIPALQQELAHVVRRAGRHLDEYSEHDQSHSRAGGAVRR